ncbi:MAG: helicase HerA domain-containing protein [Pirellulales bacterium]
MIHRPRVYQVQQRHGLEILASNAILYFGLRKTTLQELKPMQDETFEKLGQFYLGKQFDMDRRERTDQHLLYDSRDLCTQAVVVGMTGSGKTVLRIDLLEEAAMDNIPAIVIDPKGDISNLLLTFPGLSAEEFLPLD